MEPGLWLVPKLVPLAASVGNSALGGSLPNVLSEGAEEKMVKNEVGEGEYSGGNNKQKQKDDGELILVMEPQNPSPTKYFDRNGYPLKRGVAGDKVTKKQRSKLTITCQRCMEQFDSKQEYECHYWSSYHQEPVYCCMTCDKKIDKYKAYRLHVYRHTNSANQRYTCGTCSKVFHQKSDLSRHESVHQNQPPLVEVVVASSGGKTMSSIAVSSKVQPGRLSCDRCKAVFGSRAELRAHGKKSHKVPKQMVECEECGKILSAGSLYSHRKIHSDGPKFECHLCDRSFVQKINFIHHCKKHLPNDERPFPCEECGKAFFEKSHLQRHQHFHSQERPHKCDLCGRCYKTERCLKVHTQVHSSTRPFMCDVCDKGFLSSSKLRQHKNVHSGDRPFRCNYCPRDFTNFPNWLKHTRRRHKVDHRTGEKLVSIPKFMTKKKDKPESGKGAVTVKQAKKRPPPKEETPLPTPSIKEESLPFVGENSNIDLNLVSKDDLLQPLKMEEMDDIYLELPGRAGVLDEDAQHAAVASSVATSASEPSIPAEDESEQLEPVAEAIYVDPPPLGLSEVDNELFQFDYVQPEFDCDFSVKSEFSLRAEAVNVIGEIETASGSGSTSTTSTTSAAVLPVATGALVYDINGELPIFPTLISIVGAGEQQFRLINPISICMPQLRRNGTEPTPAMENPAELD